MTDSGADHGAVNELTGPLVTRSCPIIRRGAWRAANMLLTRGGNAYTNDANGNTLTGGGRTNTWDSQNRLVQCAFNGTTTTRTYAAGVGGRLMLRLFVHEIELSYTRRSSARWVGSRTWRSTRIASVI